jgi:hypothetical protein
MDQQQALKRSLAAHRIDENSAAPYRSWGAASRDG